MLSKLLSTPQTRFQVHFLADRPASPPGPGSPPSPPDRFGKFIMTSYVARMALDGFQIGRGQADPRSSSTQEKAQTIWTAVFTRLLGIQLGFPENWPDQLPRDLALALTCGQKEDFELLIDTIGIDFGTIDLALIANMIATILRAEDMHGHANGLVCQINHQYGQLSRIHSPNQ